MIIAWSALIVGLLGSFHCIGMCGPIALSLPGGQRSFSSYLMGRLLYNLGRVVTYTALGIGVGIIGQGFSMAGIQQWLSLLIGILMILVFFIPSLLYRQFKPMSRLTTFVKTRFGSLIRKRSMSSLLALGMINGLLPCGLVYVALAAALAAGSLQGGMEYMFFFGLGTLPMMLGLSLAGNFIGAKVKRLLNRMIPGFILFLGILFILRGLSLGIPYVSPTIQQLEAKTGITICM